MKEQKNASVEFMDAFCTSMDVNFSPMLDGQNAVCVGVSGGADSFALCFALSRYFSARGVTVHAITVDHGLRPEAADEARHVGLVLSALPNVHHVTLRWNFAEKPSSRVQEQARNARYDLMMGYMEKHSISHLFLGHHMDDQAETFLFRLAKGSGLDGLACMPFIQKRDAVFLCRPMLGISKDTIVSFCGEEGINFVEDPSNNDDKYARVRLRASMDILAHEGLTSARLAQAALRMGRARAALDRMADKAYENTTILVDTHRIVFDFNLLKLNDKEVVLRVAVKAITHLSEKKDYGVRMNKVERLCEDLLVDDTFRKQTLGGVIFDRDDVRGELSISKEM
jgi:tRNA(Ile)-lysidine synthase